MSKKFISRYHQYNKETQQKEAHERYQNLSKEENGKKNSNMDVNVTKISQKMKNGSLLGIEKNIIA